MISEIFHWFVNYIENSPLEIPAFIIAISTYFLTKRKFQSLFAKIIFERIPTSKSPFFQLKIYHSDSIKKLSIVSVPTIFRKRLLFYKKLNFLVDYNVEIDNKTNQQLPNVYYIHLNQFEKFNSGRYMIKVNIDSLPHKLKYKFSLPIIDPVQNIDRATS